MNEVEIQDGNVKSQAVMKLDNLQNTDDNRIDQSQCKGGISLEVVMLAAETWVKEEENELG